MSNALFRLINNAIAKEQTLSILNVLYKHFIKQEKKDKLFSYEYEEVFIYYITLIKINKDFKIKLKKVYEKDKQ